MRQQGKPVSAAEIGKTVAAIRDFDYGRPRTALAAVDRLINQTHGNAEARRWIEKELAEVLASDAPVASKQFACEKLWMIGADAAVPALERMLADSDAHVAEAGCYAIAQHLSPAASRALRNALDNAGGNGLVAVINLLGDRRDQASAGKLAELAAGADEAVAGAAIAALGKIATPEAVRTLTDLHAGGSGKRRGAAAHALLESGQRLVAAGKASEAKAVCMRLTAASEPPHIRRGARISLEEISK